MFDVSSLLLVNSAPKLLTWESEVYLQPGKLSFWLSQNLVN